MLSYPAFNGYIFSCHHCFYRMAKKDKENPKKTVA